MQRSSKLKPAILACLSILNFLFNQIEMAGTPQDSGISLQTVTELGPSIPLFGVCMGLQCIGEAFGGLYINKLFTSLVSL